MSSPADYNNLPLISYLLGTLNQLCSNTNNITLESFNKFCNNINNYYADCPALVNNADPLAKERWLMWLNYVGRISPYASTDASVIHVPQQQQQEQQQDGSTGSFEQVLPQNRNTNINVRNNHVQRALVPTFGNVSGAGALPGNAEALEVPIVIETSNQFADDDSYVSLATNNVLGNNGRALHNIQQVVLHNEQRCATSLRNDNQLASCRSLVDKKKDIFFISNAIPELQLISVSYSHSVVKDMFQERFVCINDNNYSLILKDRVRNNNGNNGLSTCVYICSCQVGKTDPSKVIRMRFSTPILPKGQTRPEYLYSVAPPNGLDRDLLKNHYRIRGPNDIRTIKSTTYDLPVVLEDFDGKSVMTNMYDYDITSEAWGGGNSSKWRKISTD